ncbi:MAG TPA: hypothetical protein VF796_26790 [Humisphaera sp.]
MTQAAEMNVKLIPIGGDKPVDPAVKAAVGRELDEFIGSLGLTPSERRAVAFVAMNLMPLVDTIVAGVIGGDVTADPAELSRVSSLSLGVALKSAELRARVAADVCVCPTCQAKRLKALGWRGRVRRRVRELFARARRAWND